jgi:hypothetical protein
MGQGIFGNLPLGKGTDLMVASGAAVIWEGPTSGAIILNKSVKKLNKYEIKWFAFCNKKG